MKILLVEDNHAYGDLLNEELKQAFGSAEWLKSESDFRFAWTSILDKPPSIAIIDVMLKWDIPRREKRPRAADAPDMYRAGIRCARMLKNDPRTHNVPIVLYSVVDREDLESDLAELHENVTYLPKSSPERLISIVRQLTETSDWPEAPTVG